MFRNSRRKLAGLLNPTTKETPRDRLGRNAYKSNSKARTGRKLLAEQLEARNLFAGLSFESAFAIGDGMNATSAQGGVIIDDSGNSYVSGYFQGVVDFAPSQTLPGDTDILASTESLRDLFVAKYDANDQLIWAKGFGSSTSAAETINGMAIDAEGNFYAVGRFQETLTIDDFNVISAGADDGFLLKLDSNGAPQWLSSWGTELFEYGWDVATSAEGEVYTVGRKNVDTTAQGGSTEIRKFDPANGSELWMKNVESGSYQSMIDVDSQGNVNLAGTFKNAFDADPGPGEVLISHGEAIRSVFSTYAIQLNSDGNLNWARGFEMKTPTVSSNSLASASDLAVDQDDNLVIVGTFHGRVDFDPSGSSTTELSESHRTFVVKLSAEGEFQWVSGVTGSYQNFQRDLAFDSANNLILTGFLFGYSETLDFDPGPGTAYLTPLNNDQTGFDGYIWSLTEAGEFRSITHFGALGQSAQFLGGRIDASGRIHAVGGFEGQVDFDPGLAEYPLSSAARSGFSLRLDINPGVTVNRRVGHVTSEQGQSTSFEVSLDSRPSENVYLPLSSSDLSEGTVNVVGLHFTPTNWNVPQSVTVAGVNDSSFDGDVAYAIVLGTLVSNDPAYAGINPADVAVINQDDEVLTTKFYVVDDATANRTFEYAPDGSAVENYSLNGGNSSPRGAASTVAGDKVWVIDANKKIYVYNNSGVLQGSWTAGSVVSNATIEGITTNGTDIWLVDARQDRVYRYAGAASRLSGSQNAASSFALNSGNRSPKDIVTDGSNIWVVNDSTTDRVFKYTMTGSLVGSWTIDSANKAPTGLTIDPSGASQSIWIVDNGTDRVYEYTSSRSLNAGSQSAALSFALATGNTNPQGIADPPAPKFAGSSFDASTRDSENETILDENNHSVKMYEGSFLAAPLESLDSKQARRFDPPQEAFAYAVARNSVAVDTTPKAASLLSSRSADSTVSVAVVDEAFATSDWLIDNDPFESLWVSGKTSVLERRLR